MYTREEISMGDVIQFAVTANNVHGLALALGRVMQVYNSYVVVVSNNKIEDVLYCNIAYNVTKKSDTPDGYSTPPKKGASKKGMPGAPVEKPGASLAEMKLAVAFAVHLNEEQYRAKMIDLALATRDEELFMTWSKGVAI